MSRKANRLRGRLRIERERVTKEQRRLFQGLKVLNEKEARLAKEERELDRSVALRMKVQRPFDRPAGDAYAVLVTFHPREFQMEFYRRAGSGSPVQNATMFAERKGEEIGRQIADVIARCILGQVDEFAKAR